MRYDRFTCDKLEGSLFGFPSHGSVSDHLAGRLESPGHMDGPASRLLVCRLNGWRYLRRILAAIKIRLDKCRNNQRHDSCNQHQDQSAIEQLVLVNGVDLLF